MPIPSINRPPEPKDTSSIPKVKRVTKVNNIKEKKLMAVHGIDCDKIKDIAGTGIASPSIGIVAKGQTIIGFGNGQFLVHPSKINPKTTPVYDRDAWTPRFNFHVVDGASIIPEKFESFKKEMHGLLDDALKEEYSDEKTRESESKYLRSHLERHLESIRNEKNRDELRYKTRAESPALLTEYINRKNNLELFEDRKNFWNKKVDSFISVKKVAKHKDTGEEIELTPENEKAILKMMRGKGGGVKLGEFGGIVGLNRKKDFSTAIDGLVAKKFGSYRELKYEANKKLVGAAAVEPKACDYPHDGLAQYSGDSLKKICIKALRSGMRVSDYLAKQRKVNGKSALYDASLYPLRAKTEEEESREESRVGRVLDEWLYNWRHKQKQPYFEAKPQRFFKLSDFSAAAIPEGANNLPEILSTLDQHGVKYGVYGNEEEKRQLLVRLATENDLLLSEEDLGLDKLIKSNLANELEEGDTEQELLELVKRAVELEELSKGAMQRLAPFDPIKEKDIVTPGKYEKYNERLNKSEEQPSSPCVLTIITNGVGQMLFIKRNDNNKWSVCAGHIEGDEEPEAAARREILEETGLQPEYLTRIPGCDFPNMTCFTAHCQGIPNGRNDPDNEGKPQWVDTRQGIPANIWDHLAGPEDDTNIIRKLFSKNLGLKKCELEWLDAGFLDLSKAIADIPVGPIEPMYPAYGYELKAEIDFCKSEGFEEDEVLKKGAMQRLYPFDPAKETNKPVSTSRVYSSGTLGEKLDQWTGDEDYRAREAIGNSISPEAKQRSLHKLHSLTQVRRNPQTGEREFLLHRGHGDIEGTGSGHDIYHGRGHTSWTPDKKTAHQFAVRGKVTSAWIPEQAIKGYIPEFGNWDAPTKRGKTTWGREQEVIVGPGKFNKVQLLNKAEDAPEELKLVHQPKEAKDKNLVVVHNLSEENLHHAEELGGLAAPSIAIHHKDHSFVSYGEITLVAHPKLVDPELHVPVFNADAYSARHPIANYKVNKKNLGKLLKELQPHADKVSESGALPQLEEEIERNGAQGAVGGSGMKAVLKAAYLHEKGYPVTPLKKPICLHYPELSSQRPVQDFFLQHGKRDHVYNDDTDYIKEMTKAFLEAVSLHTKAAEGVEPGLGKQVLEDAQEALDEEGNLHYWVAKDLNKDAGNIGKVENDRWGTQEAISDKIEELGLEGDYDKWAINKVKPAQSTPYIPQGRKKLPYTMDNILRAVIGHVRGTEKSGVMFGTGFARAKGAHQFKSLDDIKSHQGQLVNEEEMKKVKDVLGEKFNKVAEKISRYHSVGGFLAMDALVNALGEFFKRGHSLRSELRKDQFTNVPERLVEELRQYGEALLNSGTEYFEAKPQRAVQLQEFHGAVVPDNVKPETIDVLKRHGLDIKPYKKGDEIDRMRAVNELADENDLKLSEADLQLEPLNKGAMARLYPFDPHKAKAVPTNVFSQNKARTLNIGEALDSWTSGLGSRSRRDAVGEIVIPGVRERAIHRLHGLTEVRRNPKTGEKEFLLHRAHSKEESHPSYGVYSNKECSSWTPNKRTSQKLFLEDSDKYGTISSAWIPESSIKSYVPLFGKLYKEKKGPPDPLVSQEKEVIVSPGNYEKAK